jgi:hypothetical protein
VGARVPVSERDHDRLEVLTVLGQLVDPRAGGGRELAAPHDARLFELPESVRDDARLGVGESCAQVGEALRPEQQLADHQERPALADDVEGARHRAGFADTVQPDPDAAAAFYGGLFGWQFEDVMPPGAPGTYLVGASAAATSVRSARSPPRRRRQRGGGRTSRSRAPKGRRTGCVRRAAA